LVGLISSRVHPPELLVLTAPPTAEFHSPSLHDALPIFRAPGTAIDLAHEGLRSAVEQQLAAIQHDQTVGEALRLADRLIVLDRGDRKSTRLNSSHGSHSYAVFCLKKKNTNTTVTTCTII